MSGDASTLLRLPNGLVIDCEGRRVQVAGRDVALSDTEFRLLEVIALGAGEAVSRQQILDRVWGNGYRTDTTLVETNISTLRRKLRARGAGDVIETIVRAGYLIRR